jgi:hypothetical protein
MKRELSSEEIYMKSVKKRTYKTNFISSLPDNYQRFNFAEKVKFWAGILNHGMRLQVEKGDDEYSTFTPEWYKTFQEVDSNVDEIMEEVFHTFSKYEWSWSKEEYLRRIITPIP